MPSFKVCVDGNVCKGCELCSLYCPKKIIAMSTHINDRGYSPAEITDQSACTGCKSCAVMCPDGAISIYKEAV